MLKGYSIEGLSRLGVVPEPAEFIASEDFATVASIGFDPDLQLYVDKVTDAHIVNSQTMEDIRQQAQRFNTAARALGNEEINLLNIEELLNPNSRFGTTPAATRLRERQARYAEYITGVVDRSFYRENVVNCLIDFTEGSELVDEAEPPIQVRSLGKVAVAISGVGSVKRDQGSRIVLNEKARFMFAWTDVVGEALPSGMPLTHDAFSTSGAPFGPYQAQGLSGVELDESAVDRFRGYDKASRLLITNMGLIIPRVVQSVQS